MADLETEHVCEATHCTVCCPVRRSYEDGWKDGESWHDGHKSMVSVGALEFDGLVALAVAALILMLIGQAVKRDSASHNN